MEKPQKNFYAIIPANVRYDNSLIPNAKLLYGEITALCNEKGYCWASDGYFADQYNVGKATIQKWLRSLEKAGHIKRSVKYREGTLEIEHRYITLGVYPILEKECTPTLQKERVNNTSINNTVNTTNNIKDIRPSKKQKAKPTRHKYGQYQNVLLSDDELKKLKKEFPNDWEQRIDKVDEYVESSGRKYKNFLATIRSWSKRDKNKSQGQFNRFNTSNRKETMPDWTPKEKVDKAAENDRLEEELKKAGKL